MEGLVAAVRRLLDRRTAVAVLLVAWIGIIVAGAGRSTETDEWLDLPGFQTLLDVIIVLTVVASLLLLLGLVVTAFGQGSQRPTRRSSVWPTLLLLVLVMIVSVFIADRERTEEPEVLEPTPAPEGAPTTTPEPAAPAQRSELDRDELASILVILAVAGAVAILSRRRPTGPVRHPSTETTLREAVSSAIGVAAEELAIDGDPRLAVMRAYRNLEVVLERHDLPRRPSETPSEHLRRTLEGLPIDTAPVVSLARLYEVARYSDHDVTEADRQEAAQAFHRIRAGMEAPT